MSIPIHLFYSFLSIFDLLLFESKHGSSQSDDHWLLNMVALRAMITGFLVPILFSGSVQGVGLFESGNCDHLQQRQAVVNGNVCATLDFTLLGIAFAEG
jgi:hypothetical protein